MAKQGWLALHRNEHRDGKLGSDIYIDHAGERCVLRIVRTTGGVVHVALQGPQSFAFTRDDANVGDYDRSEVRGEVP